MLIANTQGLKRYALGVDEWREMMPTLRMPRRKWGILCDNRRSCALCCVNLLPCLGIYSRVPSFPRAPRRSGSGLTHGQGDNMPPHFKDNIQIKATQLIKRFTIGKSLYRFITRIWSLAFRYNGNGTKRDLITCPWMPTARSTIEPSGSLINRPGYFQ